MPFADELLNAGAVDALVTCMKTVAPRRAWNTLSKSTAGFADLSLSARVRVTRDGLLADLPSTFEESAALVTEALADSSFTGWMIWPVTEAIATRALSSPVEADFDEGLEMLARLTPRLTGEFAIRAFLNADLDRTLTHVKRWTAYNDEAVRRLASEGTRPRLPWAKQVPALRVRPAVTTPILDALYRDESEIVRRSVANHVNDISRIDAKLAVTIAQRWLKDQAPTTVRLVRHAMRTLIKSADTDALALMGFPATPHVVVIGPRLTRTFVTLGEDLCFDLLLTNDGATEAHVVIDYVIHYRKSNGTVAPKVFKLATKRLSPGESITVSKRHSFKEISTRKHYPGSHSIGLQVNGVLSGVTEFELVAT